MKDVVFKSSEEEEDDLPESSKVCSISGMSDKPAGETMQVAAVKMTEVPSQYRPPDWMSACLPCKTPYLPQVGDQVVYLRQGHEQYVDAVNKNNEYDLTGCSLPCHKLPQLKTEEFMKVVSMKYEIKPPRLVCLELSSLNPLSNFSFTIKYHDMQGVVDFVLLNNTYNTAIQKDWKADDKFRCLIDSRWWHGKVLRKQAFQSQHPLSFFLSLSVRWQNGEEERLSPWDLEDIDPKRLPKEQNNDSDSNTDNNTSNSIGNIEATEAEMVNTDIYCHITSEWPSGDCYVDSDRIAQLLEAVMGLSLAEAFLVSVDLNTFPSYAMVIEYPMDLSLIKQRLVNKFYRRLEAVQFDMRHIELNARRFNQSHSHIVYCASIITKLCLQVAEDANCYDIMPLYNKLTLKNKKITGPITQLSKTNHDIKTSNNTRDLVSDDEDEDEEGGKKSDGDGTHDSSEMQLRRQTRNSKIAERLKEKERKLWSRCQPLSWKLLTSKLLDLLVNSPDSIPFQHPVDLNEFPDYLRIVGSSMDLWTVRENLENNRYSDVSGFVKDCRQIFRNSRFYNTNKRSKIYIMTMRLSKLFEEELEKVMKKTKMRSSKTNVHLNSFSSCRKKQQRRGQREVNNRPGKRRRIIRDDEDEDDITKTDAVTSERFAMSQKDAMAKVKSNNINMNDKTNRDKEDRSNDEKSYRNINNNNNSKTERQYKKSSQHDDENDDDDEEVGVYYEYEDDDDDDYGLRKSKVDKKRVKKRVVYKYDEDEDEEEEEDEDDEKWSNRYFRDKKKTDYEVDGDDEWSNSYLQNKYKKKTNDIYKSKGKQSKGQILSKNEMNRRQEEKERHEDKQRHTRHSRHLQHIDHYHTLRKDDTCRNGRKVEDGAAEESNSQGATPSVSGLFISIKRSKDSRSKFYNGLKTLDKQGENNGHDDDDDEGNDDEKDDDTDENHEHNITRSNFLPDGEDEDGEEDDDDDDDDDYTGSDTEPYSNRSSYFYKKVNHPSSHRKRDRVVTSKRNDGMRQIKDSKLSRQFKQPSQGGQMSKQGRKSTRRKRRVVYVEDEEEEEEVKVSSRGRPHKPFNRLIF